MDYLCLPLTIPSYLRNICPVAISNLVCIEEITSRLLTFHFYERKCLKENYCKMEILHPPSSPFLLQNLHNLRNILCGIFSHIYKESISNLATFNSKRLVTKSQRRNFSLLPSSRLQDDSPF